MFVKTKGGVSGLATSPGCGLLGVGVAILACPERRSVPVAAAVTAAAAAAASTVSVAAAAAAAAAAASALLALEASLHRLRAVLLALLVVLHLQPHN